MLAATLLLGVTFLCIEGVEYHHEVREGRVPFLNDSFHWTAGEPGHGRLFFNLYFAMTGLHALHLLIGCGLMGGLLVLSRFSALPARFHMQVRTAGLYWHFVDIVWVFLFPLLYLVR